MWPDGEARESREKPSFAGLHERGAYTFITIYATPAAENKRLPFFPNNAIIFLLEIVLGRSEAATQSLRRWRQREKPKCVNYGRYHCPTTRRPWEFSYRLCALTVAWFPCSCSVIRGRKARKASGRRDFLLNFIEINLALLFFSFHPHDTGARRSPATIRPDSTYSFIFIFFVFISFSRIFELRRI